MQFIWDREKAKAKEKKVGDELRPEYDFDYSKAVRETLINLYLRDCAASHTKLSLHWKTA